MPRSKDTVSPVIFMIWLPLLVASIVAWAFFSIRPWPAFTMAVIGSALHLIWLVRQSYRRRKLNITLWQFSTQLLLAAIALWIGTRPTDGYGELVPATMTISAQVEGDPHPLRLELRGMHNRQFVVDWSHGEGKRVIDIDDYRHVETSILMARTVDTPAGSSWMITAANDVRMSLPLKEVIERPRKIRVGKNTYTIRATIVERE